MGIGNLAYSRARFRLSVEAGVNGDMMECLISNLSLMMLRALGSRVYPTLNVKYDGRRVQYIDGIPACTQKHMCVQLHAASIVF